MATDTLDHATLSRLVEAGAVHGAHVVGQPGGWSLLVEYGTYERPLAAKNTGAVRVWRRLETLASYLKEIGLTQFVVDASNYDADSETAAKRPDRAQALKKAHEAAAYDKWFREKVQASIDDPRLSILSEEVEAYFAKKRDALRKRIEQGKA